MNNKVFYQHPNLMRALGMHETVMEVMVNVLGGGESKVKDVFDCWHSVCPSRLCDMRFLNPLRGTVRRDSL